METLIRIVVFQIGTGYFGLDIRNIEEIVEGIHKPEISNGDLPVITETLNIHENRVPILNLHEKFQTKLLRTDPAYYIIVSLKNKLVALPSDRIDRYYDVPFQHLEQLPYLIQNMDVQYFKYIANIDGMLVPLLDLEWMF